MPAARVWRLGRSSCPKNPVDLCFHCGETFSGVEKCVRCGEPLRADGRRIRLRRLPARSDRR